MSKHHPGPIRRIVGFVWPILLGLVLALILRTYVLGFYYIPSGSMLPTLQIGDMVLGERLSVRFGSIDPGSIVTFHAPDGGGDILIKRVIATEGQEVDLRNGQVYVDGVALSEPYTHGLATEELTDLSGNAYVTFPFRVPARTIWVMGDNRINSKDSRYFGPVSVDDVTSRAVFVYWPIQDLHLL